MRCILGIILSCFLSSSLFSIDENLPLSTPTQLASLSQTSPLIGGVVSPISGGVLLSKTDLIAQGAEQVALTRYYIPLLMLASFHEKEDFNHYLFYKHLQNTYRGWVYLPHFYLLTTPYKMGTKARLAQPNGAVLEFFIAPNGKSSLISSFYGINNLSQNLPSSQFDIRNTYLEKKGSQILIHTPDGTVRHYKHLPGFKNKVLFLTKEKLPSGKLLFYRYQSGAIETVWSTDPQAQKAYATLRMSPRHFVTSSAGSANYQYEKRDPVRVKLKKKRDKFTETFIPPRLLQKVSSPFYRDETIAYNDRYQLSAYQSEKHSFTCTYAPFGEEGELRVNALFFPTSHDPIYTIHYELPVAGKKSGYTEVKKSDGTRIVYHISKELLITQIDNFAEDNQHIKQQLFTFHHGRLTVLEEKEGGGRSLYKKIFHNTPYGDPQKETLIGNLTGEQENESYFIERTYTETHPHLLLEEKQENGLTYRYTYLPNTNLITAKYTQDREKILERAFYLYDTSHNLIKKIIDDGSELDRDNLMAVTQREITNYLLRENPPFLHMPEWIEENYLQNEKECTFQKKHLIYDKEGNVSQEDVYAQDQLLYSLYKSYNERGDLLSETNPLGQLATYTYDNKGNQTKSLSFSNRLQTECHYSPINQLLEKTLIGDREERREKYHYTPTGHLQTKTDSFGLATHYLYDNTTHQITQTRYPSIVTEEGEASVITHTTYDGLGRKLSSRDANGNTTHYRYNAYDSLTEITHPNGGVEYFRYDKSGYLTKEITLDKDTILYKRDIFGRVLLKEYYYEDQLVAKESFTYNAFHLLSKTDKEGYTTSYEYDGLGRKIQENHQGRIISYSYDARGYLSEMIYEGEKALIIHYKRDLLGRILEEKKEDAQGTLLYKIAYLYDEEGNPSQIQRIIGDELASEQFTYDPFQRLISYQDPYGHLTQISYKEDAQNLLGQKVVQKTTTYPNQSVKVETFDPFGKLADKKVTAEGKTLSSQALFYDPHGNLILQQEPIYQEGNYQTTHSLKYSYTPMHLVKSYTRGYGSKDKRTTSFTYTLSGKQASKINPTQVELQATYAPLGYLTSLKASDGSCHQTFCYNKKGELLEATNELTEQTFYRTLDPFGNILKERLGTDLTLEKEYDRFDRPTSITLNNKSTINYTYDALYLRKVEKGAFSHTYDTYDLSGNLIKETPEGFPSITHTTGLKNEKTRIHSPYYSQSCKYDEMGNLIYSQTDSEEENYRYDELSQLIQENETSYGYNSLFTRTQKNKESLTNNLLQEISSYEDREYFHDLNGNLIEKRSPEETIGYTYDALNQLIEVIKPEEKITFSYDPLGRRLSKTLYGKEGSWQENYLYDNETEIGSFDEKGVQRSLKILGQREGCKDPFAIAIELGNKLFVPFYDCHGNIRSVVNASTQQIEESYNFTSFGEEQTTHWKNPWRHAAKRYDPDTYLVHFGKRDYDPQLGRWLTTDPLDFVNSVNLYQYLFNNPYRYIDKDGQFAFAIPLLIWGLELALPSITTLVYTAVTATAIYGTYKAAEYVSDHVNTSSYQLHSSTVEEEQEEKTLPDKKKDVRTEPKDLAEQLTLEEAKVNLGKNLKGLAGKIKDPRYPEDLWKKKGYTHKNPDGKTIEIHYWEEILTEARHGFKFTK